MGDREDPLDLNVPPEIARLADARRDARAAREFEEADRLKADLEAAGWRVEDAGAGYRLTPLHPPDIVEARRTRYGWSGAVPAAESAAADVGARAGINCRASVVLVATDQTDELERALAALEGAVDEDVQRIVVADAPSPELETALIRWEEGWQAETAERPTPGVVWLAARLGPAAALNAGIRRAMAETVILLDTSVEPIGDVVTPLVRTLEDPTVAVTGPWGLVTEDQRHFDAATGADAADGADVAAIDPALIAFRRSEWLDRGPLDERFERGELLGPWWSLVLRDAGEGEMPRRAVVVNVPAIRHPDEAGVADSAAGEEAERRNRYRLLDRFGNREDLAVPGREARVS